MTRLLVFLLGFLMTCALGFCTREDGLPDPPPQVLVPCNPDASSDDPLACPVTGDDAGTAPAEADAGL